MLRFGRFLVRLLRDWVEISRVGISSRTISMFASFSEAVAYLEQDIDLPNRADTFHELNFQLVVVSTSAAV